MRKKEKIRKNEWNGSRWMEFGMVLMACVMVFFGWEEYQMKKQMEANILQEQMEAEQIESESQQQEREQKKITSSETNAQSSSENQRDQPEMRETIRVLLMNNNQKSCMQEQVILKSTSNIIMEGSYSGEIVPDTVCDVSQFLTTDGYILAKSDAPISVLSLKRSQGIPSYEGTLKIYRKDADYYIVNEVNLETYLKYVVPSEMPASYPQEALKAQAVCARTYAVRQMKSSSLAEYGADVDDTVAYQVYNNIPRQNSTDAAVEDTRGVIMCNQNEPIQAYFFSTSCGFTSSDDVWSGTGETEYLRSIPVSRQSVETLSNSGFSENSVLEPEMTNDEFEKTIGEKNPLDYEYDEPWYRWEVTIHWEELERRAKERYPEIGQLQQLEISQRSSGGAAKQLILKGSSDSEMIETEYHIRKFLSPGEAPIKLQDGSFNTSMELLPSAYIVIQTIMEEEKPSALSIHGGGYGHGVGMSQNGAKYLALDGLSWQQILSVFYKNYDTVHLVPGN